MGDFLDIAIEIAKKAHKDQVDKYGAPYINHVTRVMNAGFTEEEKIVGMLHDLVEDTDWTYEMLLHQGFSPEIVEAIRCLTKTSDDEDYDEFVERIKPNPLAVRVKLNDLADNMDIRRMPKVKRRDVKRLNKYLRAYKYLAATTQFK